MYIFSNDDYYICNLKIMQQPLYIYRAFKMVFFENYFHLNQQMPTTSGFRDDFFYANSRLKSNTSHFSVSAFSILRVGKSKLCINQRPFSFFMG